MNNNSTQHLLTLFNVISTFTNALLKSQVVLLTLTTLTCTLNINKNEQI